jgi:integrase
MSFFRDDLTEALKKSRPNITESSVKTYVSNLVSLCKKLKGDESLEWFTKDKTAIMDYIKEHMKSTQTQKTALSSLFILTGETAYRELMIDYCKQVNDKYKEQKLTPEQKQHRISFDAVREKYAECLEAVKQNPTEENYQKYIACSFSSGVLIPPRRSEYANVMLKDYDKDKDNYLLKNKIVFNQYKTVKKYGTQSIDIPKEVQPILKKYLKTNKSKYLFPKKNGDTCFTNTDYNRLLQKIFGEKIGTDYLRSIYLSDVYKDIPKLKELEDRATAMGHTISTQLNDYVKKDD